MNANKGGEDGCIGKKNCGRVPGIMGLPLGGEYSRRAFLKILAAAGLGTAFSPWRLLYGPDCGAPPPAKPQRWTGGESFPPLPLPATPLRRSEKKRPPSRPDILGKLEYGKVVSATTPDGRRYTYRDWTTDPGDTKGLMRKVQDLLHLDYDARMAKPTAFSWDPEELPIIYITGHEGFTFNDEIRKKIRIYLQDGGTLLLDACCGMKEFQDAFIEEMQHIFPRRKTEVLPSDHPLLHAAYEIGEVEMIGFDQKPFKSRPVLWGTDIGCRTAVIFSQYDLSCGWDNHRHDHGRRVWSKSRGPEDAFKLGLNMIAYILAEYPYGRSMATEKVFHEAEQSAADKLAFGQIVHGGDWDPSPDNAAGLLKYIARNTAVEVRFKKTPVELAKMTGFGFPLLYMTGHRDFSFSGDEVKNLRSFLAGGGVLLADACCGRKEFDAAFRREMDKVIPGGRFKSLPDSHPVYHIGGRNISKVEYSPRLAKALGSNRPTLEGISAGGSTAVIYSPYGLGSSWDGRDRPYALCYQTPSALAIGANVVAYALTR